MLTMDDMIVVSVRFDNPGEMGAAWGIIRELVNNNGVGARSREAHYAIEFTLKNAIRILSALRKAEESGDLLETNDPAFLHKLMEKFEEAAELAGVYA